MNLPSSCSTQPGRGGFGLRPDPFIARKQQALALHLVRQLADTQFRRADAAGSERLWQEVALLEIDPERITALLYSGIDPNDHGSLRAADDAWLAAQAQLNRRGWGLRHLHLSGRRRWPQVRGIGIGISTSAGAGAQASTR